MKEEIFEFIKELIEDHNVNLFGVRPYLIDNFNLTKKEATEYLIQYKNQ